jgi:hypothetical protein
MKNPYLILVSLFTSSVLSCKKENDTPALDSNSPYRVGTKLVFNRPVSYLPGGYNDTILFAKDTVVAGEKYLKAISTSSGGISMIIRKDKDGNIFRYWVQAISIH